MNKKALLINTLGLLLLTVICILFIDRPLAEWLQSNAASARGETTRVLGVIEIIFGFTVSKYLYGFMLLLIAIVVRVMDKNWKRASVFLFIGSTHIVSRLTAGILKNVFHRSRPFQYLEDKNIADFFTDGGSSFPSGHVAHFFGLFLPLIFLYPKYKWLLLLLPLFVLSQRVSVNDHYLGDAAASVLIAYLFTYLFYFVFKINKQRITIQ
jgi:membrane-associated phospholipid phosphatase